MDHAVSPQTPLSPLILGLPLVLQLLLVRFWKEEFVSDSYRLYPSYLRASGPEDESEGCIGSRHDL